MTFFKISGGILILLAGTGTSLFFLHSEREKVRVLDRWIDLIRYIRTQIDCYLTPLDRIFSSVDPGLLPASGISDTVLDLQTVLQKSRPDLDPEADRLLDAFVREIGSLYREEQVKRCDFFITSLQKIRDRRRAELPGRLRLAAVLPVCGAIALTVLLW